MAVQSFANQMDLFGGRIVDRLISLQVMCRTSGMYDLRFPRRAILIRGIRQKKNASHLPGLRRAPCVELCCIITPCKRVIRCYSDNLKLGIKCSFAGE